MAGFDTFTTFHTILSLIWLVAGVPVIAGLVHARMSNAWTVIFLVTAILTCVTGFFFKSPFMASHVVGILSLILLLLAVLGLYVFRLAGAWRWVFAVSMVVAFYFNVFVAIVQAFRKIPFLNAFAPTQMERPFAIVQVIALLIFVWLIYAVAKRFRPGTA